LSHVQVLMGLDRLRPPDAARLQRDTGGAPAVSPPVHAIVGAGLVSLLALGLGCAVEAWEFQGRVVGTADGDTLRGHHDGRPQVTRLHGIDAPEMGQAFGTRAKQCAVALAFGQTVVVSVQGLDRFGRTIGDVTLPDGRSLNQELVRAGCAWWYRRYSADQRLAMLETEARATRRGLWTDPNPQPPWEWRNSQPQTGPQRARVPRHAPQRFRGVSSWPMVPAAPGGESR
jgi:endonuclease YncB( thermonuclease family)